MLSLLLLMLLQQGPTVSNLAEAVHVGNVSEASPLMCFSVCSVLCMSASVLFPYAGTGLDATAAQKHATVLGLSAFVLASPYDVPEWLPTLLLALVRAASQPAPIKTSVR